jgi:uncharacterized protein (DUF697 family)
MKNNKFSIKGFLSVLLIAAIAYAFGTSTGHAQAGGIVAALIVLVPLCKPWIPTSIALVLGMTAGVGGAHTAGLSQEIWSGRIEGNLFKDNEFLLKSVDDSENVDYKTVHIPQSGATPSISKNRVKGGARTNPNTRTDQEVTYDIGEFTTDPILITNAEEVELSYNKIDSELSEMQLALNERVAEDILISWAPTGTALLPDGATTNANILRSTGIINNDPATVVSALSYTLGATGNRLKFTLYDVKAARTHLGKLNVPKKGRHMLMSEDACNQIIDDLIVTKYRQDASNVFDVKEGTITRLMGFDIHVRSSSLIYTNAGTPVVKAYGAAGAADDNEAILFWYEGYMSRAVGGTIIYYQAGSPGDYGDVFSCLVRCGGAKRRKTEVGVGAIVQAAA